MKVTANDMDHPRFWEMNRIARQAVGGALSHQFLAAMTDREAKAMDDAVEAMTKVLLLEAKHSARLQSA